MVAASRFGAVALVVLLVMATTLQADADNSSQDQSSGLTILHWINQLSSYQFDEREIATNRLINAGKAAAGPVADAVSHSNDPELRIRGLQVLRALYESNDAATRSEARIALKSLTESGSNAGQMAARILNPVTGRKLTQQEMDLMRLQDMLRKIEEEQKEVAKKAIEAKRKKLQKAQKKR